MQRRWYTHWFPLGFVSLLSCVSVIRGDGATRSGHVVAFPDDPSVVNVQRDFHAAGDGVADDTVALQKGLEASSSRSRGSSTKILFIPNGYNVVTEFKVNLSFATGARIIVQSEIIPDGQRPDSGIWFKGDQGEIFVSRSSLRGTTIDELTDDDQRWLNGELDKLYKGMPRHGHMANFFECVKARKEPVSDAWSHHRALTSCHLSNLAMLLQRKLRWDPEQEVFIGDSQANALLSRPRRKGYEIGA